jgi:Phosphatidylinositol-4-phosphate 5-Kinase
MDTIERFIESYSNYLKTSNTSYLALILGAFEIQLEGHYHQKFIVMEKIKSFSISPTTYYIKYTNKEEILFNSTEFPNKVVTPISDLPIRFELSNEKYLEIFETLKRDTKLLEKNGILDYTIIIITEKNKDSHEGDNEISVIGILSFLHKESDLISDSERKDSLQIAKANHYRIKILELIEMIFKH